MVVAGAGHRGPQQAAVLVDGADHGRAEDKELGVGVRGRAGIEKAAQLAVADGVVHVLARTVDPVEGLFVQQALEAVAFGHVAQGGHDDVVMVHRKIADLIERGDLVLAGRGLVVPGAHGHAELVELVLHFHHVGEHALRDDAEILVAELLPLGRTRAKERAPRHLQVGTGKIVIVVDAEIFLLQPGKGDDGQLRLDAEDLEHAPGRPIERLTGAQQRGLLVQRHARPREEHGGDAEEGPVGVLHDVGGARHVPGGVAARLKGGAQTAGREGGSVRLAANEHIAGKFGDDAAVAVGHEEAVVLLRRLAGERIEDVGEMRGALLDGPVLHDSGHGVGDGRVHALAEGDGLVQGLVHVLGQTGAHGLVVKDVAAVEIHGPVLGVVDIGLVLVGRDGLDGVLSCGVAHISSLSGPARGSV